jgi:hypothetical protein
MLKPPITLRPKQTPVSVTDGSPVAWWKFDEPGGSSAANAAGTSLAAQIHGDARWAPAQGRLQGALELDGIRNWIECLDSTDLGFRDALSVSLWVKPHAAVQDGATLVAKGEAWGLRQSADRGEIEFALTGPQAGSSRPGNPPTVASKQPLAEDQWQHVAATYDGKRLVLYVNGIEENAVKASGPIALNNLPVTLGVNAATRGNLWRGWLDDARLFERALTPNEIQRLHSGNL